MHQNYTWWYPTDSVIITHQKDCEQSWGCRFWGPTPSWRRRTAWTEGFVCSCGPYGTLLRRPLPLSSGWFRPSVWKEIESGLFFYELSCIKFTFWYDILFYQWYIFTQTWKTIENLKLVPCHPCWRWRLVPWDPWGRWRIQQ